MEPGMESSGGHGRRGMHLQRMLGGLVVVVVANKKQKQVSAEQLQVGVFVWSVRANKNLGFRFRFPQCALFLILPLYTPKFLIFYPKLPGT